MELKSIGPTPLTFISTAFKTGPSPAVHPAAVHLARTVFFREVEQSLLWKAMDNGRAARTPALAKSLLHRVRLMLSAQTEAEFRRSLDELRDRARKQADKCMIGNETLFEHLKKDRREIGKEESLSIWRKEVWRKVFPETPAGRTEDGTAYFLELLSVLTKEAGKTRSERS